MMLAKALASASASAPKVYVEDVFSTWLYTGNGSTQTITNGIDLAGKGGLVWIKARNSNALSSLYGDAVGNNILYDTSMSFSRVLSTAKTNAIVNASPGAVTSVSSTGFGVTYGGSFVDWNSTGINYASWTFRKAAKFFDVVTYVGDADFEKVIPHNLGATPGCIIVKAVNDVGNWNVYHRSTSTDLLRLNLTNASVAGAYWGTPTSTTFTVKGVTNTNAAGTTYVAYLFAHDAGGFGDSGNDSVVSCGTFTGDSTITLGWEPQWVLFKRTDATGNWRILDNMRGMPVIASSTGSQQVLFPNTSGAESTDGMASPTPTGFTTFLGAGTYIYIAIRRGPMKTPTDATKVFSAITAAASTGTERTVGFAADMYFAKARNYTDAVRFQSRLTGFANGNVAAPTLYSTSTDAETTLEGPNSYNIWNTTARDGNWNSGGGIVSWHYFRRAPGFFDVVAYTGTGSARTVSHNLGVVPELMIVKGRNNANNWIVYSSSLGSDYRLFLDSTSAAVAFSSAFWNSTNPTASVFSLGTNTSVNSSSGTFIAYLFATCPGVSKVGSYTGSASTLDIDCGFTNGSRFVLIKRTSSGGFGDWYVFDSARGIVSGNDPYLALNRTDAENFFGAVDAVDPYSAGFSLPGNTLINDPGASFIYLAIA